MSRKIWPARAPLEIVGRSQAMAVLLAKIRKFSRFREPVLICGESGTGKELVARACHLAGDRANREFVAVNCPQQTDVNLTTSELFGHKKGSFTGATGDRMGMFETADGGVIFLDEIADLPLVTQVALLRALAEGEFRRLGDGVTRVVNTRVVAATNRSLEELVVRREFRHDLFFRLSFFRIDVPPLRERGEDWLLIACHLLERLAARYGDRREFSPEAITRLRDYHWPGNVRQLDATVTMGYSSAEGRWIEVENFEPTLLWHELALIPSIDRARAHEPAARADRRPEAQPPAGQPADDEIQGLYRQIVEDRQSFWEVIREPFLARELNRSQVKAVLRLGLADCEGSYKTLVRHLGLTDDEYQKFMDFLRTHSLKESSGFRHAAAANGESG
jgi:DNA-binding NtrC family response regulator